MTGMGVRSNTEDARSRVFRERMAKIGAPVTTYYYRNRLMWLGPAVVRRARRRLYVRHGAKDMSDLYET